MEKEAFYTALSRPFSLSPEERQQMEQLVRQYPFFQAAQIMHLQNAYGEAKYEHILHQSGIHISAPRYYYKNLMLHKMYVQPQNIVQSETANKSIVNKVEVEKELPTTTTADTKQESLQYAPSFYHIQEKKEPLVNFERDSHDFTEWLNALEYPQTDLKERKSEKAKKTAETISNFINKDKKPVSANKTEIKNSKKEYSAEQLMSQTLAEIYVKQRLYDRAIVIYKRLDLNSSEKNITFARRIEEIEELKNN